MGVTKCMQYNQVTGSLFNFEITAEQVKEARRRNILLDLDLELSRRCNLRCLYCYAASGKALPNEMSLDQIKTVINQAQDMGAQTICIVGGGEPLLHKDIFKIIDHVNRLHMKPLMVTNGTLISKDVAKELFVKSVSLVVKLNSFNEGIQDFLAGRKGTYKRIIRGLNNLLKVGYGHAPVPNLAVESVVCKQNYDCMEGIWRWARARNITPYIELLTIQGAAKYHDIAISSEQARALFYRLLDVDRQEYGYSWAPNPPIAGYNCDRHYYSCYITSQGYVQPCAGIEVYTGNIKHQPLNDIILNSPIFGLLRNIDQNIKGACSECQHSNQCYGCRGSAYFEFGDFLASDPTCWLNPERTC